MQLNKAEQAALLQTLSNEARILYILGIKPTADQTSGVTSPLNYKSLLSILNTKEEKFTLGRQVNTLIKELLSVGLVCFQSDVELNNSFNGKILVLSLTTMKVDEYSKLHLNWHTMNINWIPDQD